jgi:hypothetical protein
VGTNVTLTGTDFTGATGISFNGTAAVTFSVTNATTATATVPAGATTGNVTITTPGGTSNGVTFTVTVPVTDLIVSNPQSVSGTYNSVTITGTGVATLTGPLTVNTVLTVQTGGRLNTACQPITGAGTFTLEAGAILGICDAAGITPTGTTGAVQVTGARSFAADATYVYNGTAAQVTGAALPATVRELEANNAAGVSLSQPVAITNALRLTNGALATSGQLTLLSNATRTAYAVHAGGTTNGNVTVQRYVGGPTTASYRHLSSPVQNSTVSDLATTGFVPKVLAAYNELPSKATSAASFPNVFGFDETRGGTTPAYQTFTTGYFSPATLGTVLTPGRGYSVSIGGNRTPDFVGALTTGTLNIPLTVTGTSSPGGATKGGWHLLGNPYPQPIDWDLLTTPANLDASVYVWYSNGGSNGAYRTRNAAGVGNLVNGLIGLGQGFLVRATAATTFAFTDALRVEDATVALGRATADTRPLLTLTLAQIGAPAEEADALTVYAQAGATPGVDAGFDAVRPGPNVGLPTLSALIDGQEALISALSESALATSTTVELTATLPAPGAYTLALGELANFGTTTVELLDRLTGTRYDLAQQSAITLSATRANEEVTGRFALLFNGQRVTGNNSSFLPPHSSFLTLFPNPASAGGVVRITGCLEHSFVTVFDLAGRHVATVIADATGSAEVSTKGVTAGVYVVRDADGRTTRLVVE